MALICNVSLRPYRHKLSSMWVRNWLATAISSPLLTPIISAVTSIATTNQSAISVFPFVVHSNALKLVPEAFGLVEIGALHFAAERTISIRECKCILAMVSPKRRAEYAASIYPTEAPVPSAPVSPPVTIRALACHASVDVNGFACGTASQRLFQQPHGHVVLAGSFPRH